jgi:hypothetical protein
MEQFASHYNAVPQRTYWKDFTLEQLALKMYLMTYWKDSQAFSLWSKFYSSAEYHKALSVLESMLQTMSDVDLLGNGCVWKFCQHCDYLSQDAEKHHDDCPLLSGNNFLCWTSFFILCFARYLVGQSGPKRSGETQ